MKQLIAVVIDRDAEGVTKELMNQGVLHLVDIKEIGRDWTSKVEPLQPKVQQRRIEEVRRRVESILALSGRSSVSEHSLDLDKMTPVDLEELGRYLDGLTAEIQSVRERQRTAQEEILRLEDIRRQIELFGDLGSAVKSRSPYSFLDVRAGVVPSHKVEALRSSLGTFASALVSFGHDIESTSLLFIAMARDKMQTAKLLEEHDWQDIEIADEMTGKKEEVIEDLESRIVKLRDDQSGLKEKVGQLIHREESKLKEMWQLLRMNELFYRTQAYFSKTSRTIVFSGWLPVSKQKKLDDGIRRVTGEQCYLEWNEPGQITEEVRAQVPVMMRNPRFLSPFQALVQNYATPEYGSIDPTPFVAVSYLVMFGLMFGDAGHGAVLALIGLLGSRLYRGGSEGGRNLLRLIGWCGLSSIITGVLFGSYFGMQWFKPLWFDYHGVVTGHAAGGGYVRDIYDILVITIYFGVSVITLGLLLNWINLISKRRWRDLVFDKGGILGGWIYGAGVYTGFYFVTHAYKELPAGSLLFWLFGLPAVILALKPPIEFIHESRHNAEKKLNFFSLIDFFMQWIVELLEIFSGYLANTLSFMRVAGLGIAHVSLMIAFFEIAALVGGGGSYTIWSVLVLIVGNTMVVALEGLSAGIQSLRLNYYEFFSKYFSGTGSAYRPISVRGDENRN